MNEQVLKGNWKQLKGQVKQKWGKLTDDDIKQVEGHKDELVGKLQAKYGHSKEQAEKEVNSFCDSLS